MTFLFVIWIISDTAWMLFSLIIGSIIIYKSVKIRATLLMVAGLWIIFNTLVWSGLLIDGYFLVFTGNNIDPYLLVGFLDYIWFFPAFISAIYIFSTILIPEKRKYILVSYFLMAVVFYLYLFLNPSTTIVIFDPSISELGTVSVAPFNPKSPTAILFLIGIFMPLFMMITTLIKTRNMAEDVKKKYKILTLGFLVATITGLMTGFVLLAAFILLKLIFAFSSIIVYLALREEEEQHIDIKKKVKLKGNLFRVVKTEYEAEYDPETVQHLIFNH